jgi:hypothetical protein
MAGFTLPVCNILSCGSLLACALVLVLCCGVGLLGSVAVTGVSIKPPKQLPVVLHLLQLLPLRGRGI